MRECSVECKFRSNPNFSRLRRLTPLSIQAQAKLADLTYIKVSDKVTVAAKLLQNEKQYIYDVWLVS